MAKFKKARARIWYTILVVLIIANVAYFSGAVNYIQAQANPYFTDVFNINLPMPLSTYGASTAVIRCTVTNNLYYDDVNNNKILYSSVPASLPAGNLVKFQGAPPISGYDVDVTAFCDPIPLAVQQAVGVNYNAFYLTGGYVKDTFSMKGTISNKNGVQINQDNIPLPPNSPTCQCSIFGGKVRMDGQGIIHLYQKHFSSTDMQNIFGAGQDQSAIVDNNILYNLQFQITSSTQPPNNYIWNTNWGDDVTMQVFLSGNQQSTPPTSATSTSKVENLVWISPAQHQIDVGQSDPSLRTITFNVVLPLYTAGEGIPSVSVYYTNAQNGVFNTNPISIIQLANPQIDSSATATFAGTFTQDPFSYGGTWKLVLNPVTDSAGNVKRNDASNVNFFYYSVINSNKAGGTVVCTTGTLTTDSSGNQYCTGLQTVRNSTQGGSIQQPISPTPSTTPPSTTPPNPNVCPVGSPAGWTTQGGICLPPYQQYIVQFLQIAPYLLAIFIIIAVIAVAFKFNPLSPPHPRETITEYS